MRCRPFSRTGPNRPFNRALWSAETIDWPTDLCQQDRFQGGTDRFPVQD